MQKLHFSIAINAPKQKVWDTMLADTTYREWAGEFNPEGGTYYQGNWNQGSKMLFLGPDKTGKVYGMVSHVVANRPGEFISIEHVGEVRDGVEDLASAEAERWAGAHENYTFSEQDGVTTVVVDADIIDEFKTLFEDIWPKALAKLKQISETTS